MNFRTKLPPLQSFEDHYVVRNVGGAIKTIWDDTLARLALLYLLFIIVLAIVGPEITPYEYDAAQYGPGGEFLRAAPPSLAHPLGTTDVGHDVLSRIIYGARPTVITGLLGGSIIITIGASVGLVAGYVGGTVENVLMRITDFVYSVPLIPFAIVLIALMDIGFYYSIAVIGIILWRGSARVIRSQVLQIKERPFILAVKATGASTPRIIGKHILPNVASMAILFFALGIGYSIIVQASLAFVGVSSPFVPSWGVMVRNAYKSGLMDAALWWSLPPGFLISTTVLSAFILGRRYESLSGQGDEEAFAQMA